MSTNPFSHHTNKLFASRGCDLDAAIAYANEVITAMPVEQHIHATTALMVVINTAANAFDQARGPGPEKLAVQDMVRELVNQHLAKSEDQLDRAIEAWMDDNLNDKIDEQLDEQLDDKINDWMNDNLESKMEGEALCEAIRDAFRNNLSISIN